MSLSAQRQALIRRHLATLELVHPSTVTIGATTYAASAGPLTTEQIIIDGGKLAIRSRTFVVRLAVLAAAPAEGTLLTDESSTSWRIQRVTGGTPDQCWKITCIAPTERAGA